MLEGLEPTPRMMVNDLYRLQEERSAAHEKVIQAIIHDKDIAHYEQARESIAQYQEAIRNRLRQEA